MSEFQGPKCQEMCFPAFDFQKCSGEACPLTPLETMKAPWMGAPDRQPPNFPKPLAT